MASFCRLAVCIAVLRHTLSTQPTESTCTQCAQDVKTLLEDMQVLQTTVSTLTTNNTDLESKMNALLDRLAAKRCEQGLERFHPHAQIPNEANERVDRKQVNFTTHFPTQPSVIVSLIHLNLAVATPINSTALRYHVGIDGNVTTSGFPLFVSEWGDTVNRRTYVQWTACAL